MKLCFKLTLVSDYHVGAGHGRGSEIDAALLRDGDGIPALRGTTLVGLLRDSLRQLCQLPAFDTERQCQASGKADGPPYCQDAAQGTCPVCRVFGSPARPKRWQVSTARPSGATSVGDRPRRLSSQGAQVVRRVRVDPVSRRAEKGKLFSEEEGDQRLTFEFQATCLEWDKNTEPEAALMVAAARFVRNLGGTRRRGRGECRIHLDDSAKEKLHLDFFGSYWLDGKRAPVEGEARPGWVVHQAGAAGPRRFIVIARTDEPALIAGRGEAGNQLETSSFIPGSTILGAFAHAAAARWRIGSVDRNDEVYRAFVRVFRRGAVRFPTLYFARHDGGYVEPAFLAPRDLHSCELHPGFEGETLGTSHGALGQAVDPNEPADCAKCEPEGRTDVRLAPLGGFVTVGRAPRLFEPALREELHVRIEPETRRAATGALFGYTALEVGQYFMGELVCADNAAWQELCQLTGLPGEKAAFPIRVGRAARRGYGGLTLWFEPIGDEAEPPRWVGATLDQRVSDLAQPLSMTLLTDGIFVDCWGRSLQSMDDGRALASLLGVDALGASVTVKNAYCAASSLDAFNNHLGLPRWRDLALVAGSTVGFVLDGTFDHDALKAQLRRIERHGLGERRHEGFGQVAFNHPVYRNGDGITLRSIKLEGDLMKLSDRGMGADLRTEAKTIEDWKRQIKERIGAQYADERWGAVARWLARGSGSDLAGLMSALDHWGKPGSLLKRAPQRDKPNFFELDESAGIKRLKALLTELEGITPEPRLRALGVRMLAEQLAERSKPERSS